MVKVLYQPTELVQNLVASTEFGKLLTLSRPEGGILLSLWLFTILTDPRNDEKNSKNMMMS